MLVGPGLDEQFHQDLLMICYDWECAGAGVAFQNFCPHLSPPVSKLIRKLSSRAAWDFWNVPFVNSQCVCTCSWFTWSHWHIWCTNWCNWQTISSEISTETKFCALVIAAVLLRERNFHITFAPLSRSKCGAVEACLWVINFSWKTMREKNFRRKIQEGLIQEQKANLQYIVTMSSQPHNSLDCLFSDIASSFRCFMFRIQGCLKALFPL